MAVAGASWELGSGSASGSGWMTVVSYDAVGQGGSNGGSGSVGVAVLAEIWWFEYNVEKKTEKKVVVAGVGCVSRQWPGEWQWLHGSGTSRRGKSRRFEWW
jgi:hypothetical protein